MRPELKHIAYPNIAYTICWHKEQFVEELIPEHLLFHIVSGELYIKEATGGRLYRAGETILLRRNHLVKCGSHPLPGGTPNEVIYFKLDRQILQDICTETPLEKRRWCFRISWRTFSAG